MSHCTVYQTLPEWYFHYEQKQKIMEFRSFRRSVLANLYWGDYYNMTPLLKLPSVFSTFLSLCVNGMQNQPFLCLSQNWYQIHSRGLGSIKKCKNYSQVLLEKYRCLWDVSQFSGILCLFQTFWKLVLAGQRSPTAPLFILGCKLFKYEDLLSLVFMPLPGLMLKYAHYIIHCITEILVGCSCLFYVITDNVSISPSLI